VESVTAASGESGRVGELGESGAGPSVGWRVEGKERGAQSEWLARSLAASRSLSDTCVFSRGRGWGGVAGFFVPRSMTLFDP